MQERNKIIYMTFKSIYKFYVVCFLHLYPSNECPVKK
jgi:hypothetical protein